MSISQLTYVCSLSLNFVKILHMSQNFNIIESSTKIVKKKVLSIDFYSGALNTQFDVSMKIHKFL